ncbi:MAG: DUF4339 domain-containing protein [Verrucomicrobia bacterium]|nr:DUF4339 domain-containing protein [Verrucomicrobiota bacterium]
MVQYILTMGIWQLINIVLFWVFFGFLSAYVARKKGRNPKLWFFAGLILGVFGVVLVYVLPSHTPAKRPEFKPLSRLERSESWIKMWYYLDPKTREQKGPVEFSELAKTWKDKVLNDSSLVWGEGMPEWKQLSQLPEVMKEFEVSQK